MAYVPPHKRVSDANRFKPSPSTPPSSSTSPFHPKYLRRDFLPNVSIRKSSRYIGVFIVAYDNRLRGQNLQFVKFDGETFGHLQHLALYTLQLAGGDSSKSEVGFNDEMISVLSLKELKTPADTIFERLRVDLERMFDNFTTAAQVNRTVPGMWFKFGTLLFINESRIFFDWGEKYSLDDIEDHFQEAHFLKVFDNALTEEEYHRLHEFANRDATQTWFKERYYIKVSDLSMSDKEVWCICQLSSKSDDSSSLSGRQDQAKLQINKIRMNPVRHMVCDVSCAGKKNDIRLMFYTKDYLHGLTHEELQDIESCLNNARIDDNVKGGLTWTLGTDSSSSGRFKIVSSFHELSTFVIGGELKWRFQKCNRVEFKASSGRVTYEVNVKPTAFREFKKGTRSTDEFMLSLRSSFHHMWKLCSDTL